MIHYIYKTTNISTGEFYIGKRSTKKYSNGNEDPYVGSGIWILNMNKEEKNSLKKKVLLYCENVKILNECEIKTVKEYYNDPLNKNISLGGDGASPGKYNCRYLNNKTHWYNLSNGSDGFYTQQEIIEISGMSSQSINGVLKGRHKRSGDWILYEYKDMKVDNTKNKKIKWKNILTQEEYEGSQKSFCKKYGISLAMACMIVSGKRKSKEGWSVKEN